MWDDPPRHSDAACARLLDRLLLEPAELLGILAPEGWERSPLLLAFHPTPEQLAEEAERMRRNLDSLRKSRPARDGAEAGDEADPLDAREESTETAAKPVEPEREVVELLGVALWDIFSDNHSVVDAEGTAYDLGSFRGSAGFIAESINRRYPDLGGRYDYLDFYMGSLWRGDRADLSSVYRWIFGRLKEKRCRWIYSFPRLYLLDLRGAQANDDPTAYDPSEAVRAELEEAERAQGVESLAEKLDQAYEEAVRAARDAPLPPTVAAYRDVFGQLPEGWPYPDLER
jgi:hypothetical protein